MIINGKEVADTWCSLSHMQVQIRPGGEVFPCNRYSLLGKPTPKDLNIGDASVSDLLNQHPMLRSIRGKLDNNERDPGCRCCTEEEDADKDESIRQRYNRKPNIMRGFDPEKTEVRWIEFSISNLCNLKCRMCLPLYSHRMRDDWIAIHGKSVDIPENRLRPVPKLNYDNLIVPTLRHLKFTGGEPFIIDEYKQILREVVKRLNPKEIYLNYSTNLTFSPDDEWIELWQQFKYVEFAVSLDGLGDYIEYQRHPCKWKVVERVTKEFLQLHKHFDSRMGLRSTISILNILNLPDLTDWWVNAVNEYDREPFSEISWFNPTLSLMPEH